MINFDRMQRQFEESKHYSCGESQAERLANWNVWKDAWKAGLASQSQQEPVSQYVPWSEKDVSELHAILDSYSPEPASQAQQEPTKATNLFEIVTHGESGDAWLLLRADEHFGLGHHCIKFEGSAADDLRKRFKVMNNTPPAPEGDKHE